MTATKDARPARPVTTNLTTAAVRPPKTASKRRCGTGSTKVDSGGVHWTERADCDCDCLVDSSGNYIYSFKKKHSGRPAIFLPDFGIETKWDLSYMHLVYTRTYNKFHKLKVFLILDLCTNDLIETYNCIKFL